MIFKFNKPAMRIRMTKEELQEFFKYLVKCDQELKFRNYGVFQEREIFMRWHFYEVGTKIFNKLGKLYYEPLSKKTSIVINFPEQKTLSFIFQRVECDPFVLQMQPRFIHNLVLHEKNL